MGTNTVNRNESTYRVVSDTTPLYQRGSMTDATSVRPMKSIYNRVKSILVKYGKFIGPGLMVSVAYMDPGNYSTSVSGGAAYEYKLLFVIFMSNIFAVFLQIFCIKLGSVTGMDLAQCCREYLPPWLNLLVYVMTEFAIIATDLAEVVGTAISLNILFNVPLFMGVLLTIVDVLVILMAYRPNGPLKLFRYFEYFVSFLVVLVVICLAIELAYVKHLDTIAILKGFLPSKELLETDGVYLACGILGATVMPHSLYLGSGLVQPRLRDYDIKHGYFEQPSKELEDNVVYKPSIHAIRSSLSYSIAELIISLFTVAVFVNGAILIVAGASLHNQPEAMDADLFSIYEMLRDILSPIAGTVFALALLFSGQSAGVVCTLSGQMVSEGFLHWSIKPWLRRLITRGIAIVPCLFVAIFVGRKGLADVLNASQVVLSLLLPFCCAPLLYFTSSKKIMKVERTAKRQSIYSNTANTSGLYNAIPAERNDGIATTSCTTNLIDRDGTHSIEYIDMSNGRFEAIAGVIIFSFISFLNLFLIISMTLGADIHL
ncbi:natural resistance-associated macrophage protein [Nadsonia fulvescens var. elongata DSM 6958]|uniref:Natural resistance-associated macrophage protein n=1 Tax=Nadsonia fulvescens var. elongata DSM 6958 TaxID=857566 RepID=A0A1E3PK14_9ASCO|nr:natural resistance-associated macrophage protein [Nadsonia fulvescens var. elongata DSM 6958]